MKFLGFDHCKMTIKGKNSLEITLFNLNNSKSFGIQLTLAVAVVAVLQFQNRFYDSQKLTLYLCINIEVFLGYGN
jgi:hypothetical protein